MKIFGTAFFVLALGIIDLAQSRSVWIADYTGQEVMAAVAAGKTTLIYCGGATHADGPVVATGKHVNVGRYVAQRVAEELGNALVLPINPYAPASAQMTHTSPSSAAIVGGTVSLSDETYSLVTKDVINSTLRAVRESEGLVGPGFKSVMVMSDHSQGQDTLQRVAKDLDAEWKSKGVRVYYIDLAPVGKRLMNDYLKKLNVPAPRMTPIDDETELMFVDHEHQWVRQDKIPSEERRVATPETGKIFVDFKINAVVEQIRKLNASADSRQ
jgi:creatinine amidohydrolase/Fe(II)-dependent formamide hydrolase-like protein